MSSASSTYTSGIQMMSGADNLLEEAGRTLRREQSSGNRMLSSIDQDWLADHKDLLDLFVKDPNDPYFLEQVRLHSRDWNPPICALYVCKGHTGRGSRRQA
jgi:hypothetical protein